MTLQENEISIICIGSVFLLYLILGFSYFSSVNFQTTRTNNDLQEHYHGDKHNIHDPSKKGLGNIIAKYCYAYLLAMHEGKDFDFNTAEKYLKYSEIEQIFPNIIKNTKNLQKVEKPGLIRRKSNKIDITEYVHDIRHFQDDLSILQKSLGIDNIPKLNFDVIIHVRCDDIQNQAVDYTALPSSWYKEAFEKIQGPKKTILIISRKPHDKFTTKVLNIVVETFNNLDCIVKTKHGTVKEDFYDLMGASTIILSTSTFSFWASFLSPNTEQIIVPYFGLFKGSEATNEGGIYTKDWKSTNKRKITVIDVRLVKKIQDINLLI